MSQRVCHVCSGHLADDGRVFHRACVSLAANGYDVHLIAADTESEPYVKQGVTIHPLPTCTNRRQRLARSFCVADQAARLNADLYHVHEPELLGPLIARAGSRPVIYDVHESYLDVLMQREWIPWSLRPIARYLWDQRERHLVRRCAGVVAVTERIAQRYRDLHSEVSVISNYPHLAEMRHLPAVTRDGSTCVFAGALAPDRGLLQVFRALAMLKQRGLRVSLDLAGLPQSEGYLLALWNEAANLGIKDLITYHGVLSKPEAILLQHSASIGLIPYLPVANSMASLANKLLECMALGLPVVFSDFPNYREIVGPCGAGIAVDPTSPEQIAAAIERLVRNTELAQQMGEAGRRAVHEQFSWDTERLKLLELYQRILRPVRSEQDQRRAA